MKLKILKIIEYLKEIVKMWILIYLWVGVIHYMVSVNIRTAKFMFWAGVIWLILSLITSPRIKKWALQM